MIHRIGRDRCPRRRTGGMTGITHIACRDMVHTLTAGHGSIMTINTSTDDFRMVYRGSSDRRPAYREFLMAGITNITARDMTGIFTARRYPIVTGNTVADKRGVINGKRRHPGIGTVTIIAFQCRHHMSGRLALSQCSVVTG